jgi:hypothetical protein
MLHRDALAHALTAASAQYEHPAPSLATWLDERYPAVHAQPAAVSLADVRLVGCLGEEGVGMPATPAQNALYHHLPRRGKDVRTVPSFSPCGAMLPFLAPVDSRGPPLLVCQRRGGDPPYDERTRPPPRLPAA